MDSVRLLHNDALVFPWELLPLPVHHSSPLPSFDNSPPSSPMILHPGGPMIAHRLGIEIFTGCPQAPRASGSIRCEHVMRAPPLFGCLNMFPAPALLEPESPRRFARVYPIIAFLPLLKLVRFCQLHSKNCGRKTSSPVSAGCTRGVGPHPGFFLGTSLRGVSFLLT